MTKCKQKLSSIILLLLCHYASAENASQEVKEDLSESEAKDGQLEIIKTIKKINDDGSYTIGYEADDGSFKIESRDVLGNVKGTYGYLDEEGEIKRVSYSTSNITDLLAEPPSVVQRIPKINNRTYSSTRKPGVLLYHSTTQSTPTSTSVIQAIPRRRTTTQTTTTTSSTTTTKKAEKERESSRSTTNRPANVVYATSIPPRNIIYTQRPLLRSTVAPQVEIQKSEGQIIRPEVTAGRPTELPIFRRIALKNPLLENESPTIKPVSEEPEVRGNLLRRQLSQEKSPHFDPRQHVITLQQGLGDDSVDVYSASLTTGTPRPLFTTTYRPRVLPKAQVVVETPIARYVSTQSTAASTSQATTEHSQDVTTTESTVNEASTPAPVPVYHIPSGHHPENVQQPLVPIRHPFHGGVVLVPFNQLRAQENTQVPGQPHYYVSNGPYFREIRPTSTPTPEQPQNPAPIFIQRPPVLRSIPVQLDENGFVRPVHQQMVTPTPYPVTIPITPPPHKYASGGDENEVESIRPPVSTKDFQKLIELLITRQTRLEQANAIINAQRERELFYLQRYRGLPPSTPLPFLVRRPQEIGQNGPVTFIPEQQIQRTRPFITVPQMQVAQQQQHHAFVVRPQTQDARDLYLQESPVTYTPASTSYTPTKRVARLLHSSPPKEQSVNDEFLPPQIREMLLLRMLQLAINPALPLETSENEEEDSMPSEQHIKKTGVRNVEVLGEEEDDRKRPSRSRKYRGNKSNDYYE